MGLWDGVKRQLRSVIEWEDFNDNVLFHKWSGNGDEIKNASKLIVGPGQGAIFVYEGKVEAVITEEGMTELKTANIPFWTTITKFMQAFESEHKVGIYFFNRTKILDQKWGTPSVIKYQDPEYKFPVGLKAFGNYTFQIKDAGSFFVNVIGETDNYTIEDFRTVMSSRIVEPMTDYFAESAVTYTKIDAQREEISDAIEKKLVPDFDKLGFGITDFRIEGTSFDEDTMNRINRIADMTAEAAAAAAVGLNYAQVQQLEALKDAAKNEGGGAGMGMGLGAGIGFGNVMAGQMAQGFNQQGQPQGAPGGQQQGGQQASGNDPMAKLQQLKQMLDGGLISQDEFDAKKKDILSQM